MLRDNKQIPSKLVYNMNGKHATKRFNKVLFYRQNPSFLPSLLRKSKLQAFPGEASLKSQSRMTSNSISSLDHDHTGNPLTVRSCVYTLHFIRDTCTFTQPSNEPITWQQRNVYNYTDTSSASVTVHSECDLCDLNRGMVAGIRSETADLQRFSP